MEIISVSIETLVQDPKNARKHNMKNLKAIETSIQNFGAVEPLVVRKANNQVIGGNGRLEVLRYLGYKHVDVVYVDVDERKAEALGLALNKSAELGQWDESILADKLLELENDFDLLDFGFDLKNIFPEEKTVPQNTLPSDTPQIDEGVVSETNSPDEHWKDMPEFNQEDKTSFRRLIVHFNSEEDVQAFSSVINQSITQKTRFIWYPELVRNINKDKAYE